MTVESTIQNAKKMHDSSSDGTNNYQLFVRNWPGKLRCLLLTRLTAASTFSVVDYEAEGTQQRFWFILQWIYSGHIWVSTLYIKNICG